MNIHENILDVKNNGYTIIESVLSEKEIKKFKTILNYNLEKQNSNNVSAKDFHNNAKVVHNLQNKDLAFYDLICHNIVLNFAEKLLKEGSYLEREPYILCQSTARNPAPYSEQQQLHIDSNIPGLPFCFYMQAMWLLDEFNSESGGTRFVPGSHKIQSFAENDFKYDNEQQIFAPKGSLVIFDGGVWHGSSKSFQDKDRWIIINTYCRWFLKQTFDIPRGIPSSIYTKLNDFQKELLGFKCVPALNEEERETRISDHFFNPF